MARVDAQTGTVFLRNGTALGPFDAVILALPIGVLQSSAGLVSPPLPWQAELQSLLPGRFEKLVLVFDSCFWTAHAGLVDVGDSGPNFTYSSLVGFFAVPAMIVWLDERAGDALRSGAVKAEYYAEQLRKAFGVMRDGGPRLLQSHRSDWSTDRFALGCVCVCCYDSDSFEIGADVSNCVRVCMCICAFLYRTFGTPGAAFVERESWRQWHCGRVTLAGEYMSEKHYGCVHGAIDEGQAAADRVVAQLKSAL